MGDYPFIYILYYIKNILIKYLLVNINIHVIGSMICILLNEHIIFYISIYDIYDS